MDINDFILQIKATDLSKLSYQKIKAIITNNQIQLPYTTAIIRKGTPIERGRLNRDTPFFYSEFEISYRTDYGNIKEFGRANEPFSSRFYGAIPSKKIDLSRIVLFSELEKKFRQIPKGNYETTMTIGRWFVKEDFEVADVCLSENYLSNSELKAKHEMWLSKLKNSEIGQEEYINLLSFFSDEFSKKEINTHHDYKLSCLYSDYAIVANKLNGVLYPSVQTDYEGLNLVLTRDAVEKYLELKTVAMFKYKVEKGNASLYPTYYSDDLGVFNTQFKWSKV